MPGVVCVIGASWYPRQAQSLTLEAYVPARSEEKTVERQLGVDGHVAGGVGGGSAGLLGSRTEGPGPSAGTRAGIPQEVMQTLSPVVP